jgi:hypothetical protein
MLHTCCTLFLCLLIPSAEQTSSLQAVLEFSNDQVPADGNVEFRGTDASGGAIGDESKLICVNCSRMAHACHMV